MTPSLDARDARYSRRAVLALIPTVALAACGGAAPTAGSNLAIITPTPRPISTIMVTVRTGSAVIPSPTGQSAAPPPPDTPAPPMGTVTLAPTFPVPALRMGGVLLPLMGGTPYTTLDGKATVRYPTDWAVQAGQDVAQFAPRNAAPTDANVPRVNFVDQPVQLNLLTGNNSVYYTQTIAQQSVERGAMNLVVRQIEQVALGSMNGLAALKIVVTYTTTIPVASVQIIAQPSTSDRTYFFSATAPAGDYDTKWATVIDGIAGSLMAK